MKIIDLTQTISSDMLVYPGTEPPVLTTECTIDETGFLEKKITMFSHTGTHMDAPAHIIKDAKTLDLLPIEQFHGKAFLLDRLKAETGFKSRTIGIKELKPYQESIEQVEFLLINTGWSQYWNTEKYFINYPVLSLEAAEWLSRFELKGLGLDTISADTIDTQDFPVHKLFLQKNTIIIENLTNLTSIPSKHFTFSCFPISFEDADGSPTRAVAFIQ